MVQNPVQKRAQRTVSGSAANDADSMPTYLSKNPAGTGYLFRRAVPADVQALIGKREFKTPLGGDYRAACTRCNQLAVDTDNQIAEARARRACTAVTTSEPARPPAQPTLVEISSVPPDFLAQLYSTFVEQTQQGIRTLQLKSQTAWIPSEVFSRERCLATLAVHGDEHVTYGWRAMLDVHLKTAGYRLADSLRDTPAERAMLVEYARAYLAATDPSPLGAAHISYPHTPTLKPEPLASPPMLLSDAIRDFMAHLPAAQRAMKKKHELVLPAFLEVVGDISIKQLRQSHVKDFLLMVQKLPPRWAEMRRKEKLTIRDMAKDSWDTCIAAATYEGSYRASLHTFIESAKRNWQDIGFPTTLTTDFAYEGQRKKAEFKQRALRLDEIRLIFFNDRMEKILRSPTQVHKFWLLAIGLYTGARVREICQVNPQIDYGCQANIWWLRLTDEPGVKPDPAVVKSVKTQPRTIPMHAELVRLGLPDYLDRLKASGARRLFPEWAPTEGNAGAAPAKWVANYLRSIGLHGAANASGNAVRGSHAFRHTLLTYGRKNHVKLRCISGHREASDNAVADGYEDDTILLSLPTMADLLAKLDYGVVLPVPVPALIRPVELRRSQGDARRPQPRTAGTGRARQRSGP
jgi:integrase